MKIRLTQPTMKHFNGQIGVLWFEGGLSTTDVRALDAVRMSAVMLCEWEDGTSPSVAQSIIDNGSKSSPTFATDAAAHQKEAVANMPVDNSAPAAPAAAGWTIEQLEAIADKEGIKGLRAIADPIGIKAASIKELITEITRAATRVST